MKNIRVGLPIVLCLFILGYLICFLVAGSDKFWGLFLSLIPKTSIYLLDAAIRWLAALFSGIALMLVVCYVVGAMSGTKFGSKIRKKLPILKTISNLEHQPLVWLEIFPGIKVIGIITGKQEMIFDITKGVEVRPMVLTPHCPTFGGPLCFPEIEKVILAEAPAHEIVQMFVSFGFSGPKIIKAATDGPPLEFYFKRDGLINSV